MKLSVAPNLNSDINNSIRIQESQNIFLDNYQAFRLIKNHIVSLLKY